MKKITKRIVTISICAIVLGGGGFWAYSSMVAKKPAVPAMTQEEAPIPVSVQMPQAGTLEVTTDYIGRVQPDEMVNIIPKMAGTVLATYFNVGDRVKRGDLLFELDPSDLAAERASVAAAQAGLKVAQVNADGTLGSQLDMKLLQNDTSIRSAQNGYDSARQSLDDFDRYGKLDKLEDTVDATSDSAYDAEKNWNAQQAELEAMQNQLATIGYSSGLESGITQQKAIVKGAKSAYENARAAYEQAKSSYQAARDGDDPQLTQLRNALKTASVSLDAADQTQQITQNKAVPETEASVQAGLEQARASYEAQAAGFEQKLSYTKITSPIDGVIEQKAVEEHGMATQQAAAYVVSNKDIMVVKFGVPSNAAAQMVVGDPLKIEYGAEVYDGAVIEVSSLVDAQSGLFPIKARVDAPQGTLLSGVAVKITATTAKSVDTMLIPIDSLYHEGDTSYIYVLSPEGLAVKTTVETGITDDQTIEVLSGLDAQSKVITSWNPNLLDGAKVADAAEVAPPTETPPDGSESSSSSSSSASPPATDGDAAASQQDGPSSGQEG